MKYYCEKQEEKKRIILENSLLHAIFNYKIKNFKK